MKRRMVWLQRDGALQAVHCIGRVSLPDLTHPQLVPGRRMIRRHTKDLPADLFHERPATGFAVLQNELKQVVNRVHSPDFHRGPAFRQALIPCRSS